LKVKVDSLQCNVDPPKVKVRKDKAAVLDMLLPHDNKVRVAAQKQFQVQITKNELRQNNKANISTIA
jgi:hypothetical protein